MAIAGRKWPATRPSRKRGDDAMSTQGTMPVPHDQLCEKHRGDTPKGKTVKDWVATTRESELSKLPD